MSSQPNAPLTNPETASQQYRITRYGCRRCPEKDFKQKRKPRSGRDTSSVQYHVEHSHPDVDNWESLLFKWSYRIYDGKGGSTRVKLEETEEAANGADENDNRMDVDGEAGNHGEEVDNGDGDEENDETTMPTHSEHQTASTVGKGGVPPGPPQGIFHTKPPNKAPLPSSRPASTIPGYQFIPLPMQSSSQPRQSSPLTQVQSMRQEQPPAPAQTRMQAQFQIANKRAPLVHLPASTMPPPGMRDQSQQRQGQTAQTHAPVSSQPQAQAQASAPQAERPTTVLPEVPRQPAAPTQAPFQPDQTNPPQRSATATAAPARSPPQTQSQPLRIPHYPQRPPAPPHRYINPQLLTIPPLPLDPTDKRILHGLHGTRPQKIARRVFVVSVMNPCSSVDDVMDDCARYESEKRRVLRGMMVSEGDQRG